MQPKRQLFAALSLCGAGAAAVMAQAAKTSVAAPACAASSGLSLPPGFCATIFADNVGHARHMAVAADGTVYVNTWSGPYYSSGSPPPAGGFLVALRDADKDGKAETVTRFGPGAARGNAGGTGIAIYRDGLYVETNDRIVRYALQPGKPVPTSPPTIILSGMPLSGDHPMHPFAIDRTGSLLVNSGSPSNVCEHENRKPGSTGKVPCDELATRAGIWRYDANKTGQHFSPAERFSTGIRNAGGIAFDAAGKPFAVQHGRDQLSQNWPKLYTAGEGPNLPAEELLAPVRGGDFGWPMCYYDGFQKKLVLAPEYGGNGGKAVGNCAAKLPPVAAFPAHWAPNDVAIYSGSQFPQAYRGGAFIAFHGSWNRAPAPQGGYNIAFQPLVKGKASGHYTVFADGFAGGFKEPGRAATRPAGLAVAPDGALYIADDVHGRIWRVAYHGAADAPLVAATAPVTAPAMATAAKPGSITAEMAAVAPPPGFTAAQVALGRSIYHGEARDGTCSGCHGSDGRGTNVGPALTGGWLWGDGSVASLARVISAGVAKPRKYSGAMPARGGAPLGDSDVDAVAAYVWTLGHRQ